MFSNIGSSPVRAGIRRRTEPDWGALAIELKKPGVTLSILWEEYRAVHPEGYAYSRFCDLFRGFERRLSPMMRQEHVAGDKVFVDYSGKKLPIADRKTGEIREAEIFLGVLGASSYTFAEATWSQTLPDWIGSHVRMFRFFGGVPRLIGSRQSEVWRESVELLRPRDQPQLRHDGFALRCRRSAGATEATQG